jgi:hypothetical protein
MVSCVAKYSTNSLKKCFKYQLNNQEKIIDGVKCPRISNYISSDLATYRTKRKEVLKKKNPSID